MESILTSIKKLIGITEEYTQFDADIVMHINTVLMDLTNLGVGPAKGFIIEDSSSYWTDFVSDPEALQAIKSYMYLRVKLLFDPPSASYLIESMQRQIDKFEWLINVTVENGKAGIIDEAAVEELRSMVAELEEENLALKESNARLESSNAEFRAENTVLTGRVTNLERTNNNLQVRVNSLEDFSTELQDNIDGLENENSELRTTVTNLEEEVSELEASIKPEQRKTVEITENGTTEILPDNGNTLSGIDLTVNVPSSGGTEELENLIDESGVLDSTDGTATEKVEQLIDLAEWENVWYEQSAKWTDQFKALFKDSDIRKVPKLNYENAINMSDFLANNSIIETVDYYISSGKARYLTNAFNSCSNLKFIYGVDTSTVTHLNFTFGKNPLLETIQEALNFSSATTINSCFADCVALKNIRFVPETIKLSITIPSAVLSAESIQSVINGLATVETRQTLTLYSDILKKLTDEQWATMNAKNWTAG